MAGHPGLARTCRFDCAPSNGDLLLASHVEAPDIAVNKHTGNGGAIDDDSNAGTTFNGHNETRQAEAGGSGIASKNK